MTTFKDVVGYVTNEATESEARALFDAANARIKALRAATAAENIANLKPGAEVALANLKPKYLNGLRGTVQSIVGGRIVVKLDEASARQAGNYVNRFDQTLAAPASAVVLA